MRKLGSFFLCQHFPFKISNPFNKFSMIRKVSKWQITNSIKHESCETESSEIINRNTMIL